MRPWIDWRGFGRTLPWRGIGILTVPFPLSKQQIAEIKRRWQEMPHTAPAMLIADGRVLADVLIDKRPPAPPDPPE